MALLTDSAREYAIAVTRRVGFFENDADDDDVLDAFARAAWSGIGEPGDRLVGTVVEALGAYEALQNVIEARSANDLARMVLASGNSSVGADDCDREEFEDLIDEALTRWRPRVDVREACAHLERASRIGARLLTPAHELWPEGLDRLEAHGPVALWLRGNLSALEGLNRSVSVVGARASTGYGEHVAMDLVASLVDRGFSIVSGAAYGIDGMAHRAALSSDGVTIAVLAGGIDRLYPSGHDALLKRIIEQGLVITELPCGFAPTKWRFLQRNRLIAAMTCATVVVEAGWRSGSLNTAHHALDMGIPVGAVPGPITSASSAGCHRLLRETPALCVTTPNEIVELAGGATHEQPAVELIHPHAVRVLDAMSRRSAREPVSIASQAGLAEFQVLATLGLLELQGAVRHSETGWLRA